MTGRGKSGVCTVLHEVGQSIRRFMSLVLLASDKEEFRASIWLKCVLSINFYINSLYVWDYLFIVSGFILFVSIIFLTSIKWLATLITLYMGWHFFIVGVE